MDQFRPRDDDDSPIHELRRNMQQAQDFFSDFLGGKGVWLLIIAAVIFYLASGFYIVGPGEKGVELLFGRFKAVTDPGPRYRMPWPIMTKTVVGTASVRQAEIGYRSEGRRKGSIPGESSMLTGDENIVDVQLFVQYVIQDPVKFLYGCEAPEQTLKASAEVALRGVVGENDIDYTMVKGREDVATKVKVNLQKLLDTYQTGLEVTQASLLTVDPPAQVQEAFHDVVRALEDRDRLIKEAEGYMEDVLPKARGQAQQEIREAEAYRGQRVIEANGDASRFNSVLAEYAKSPRVTRERLYLESAEVFLPQIKKFIIDRDSSGALPILNLTGPDILKKRVETPNEPAPEKKGNQ
jgi:modulator of FtsH protease HflK